MTPEHRIAERIERTALAELHQAAPARVHERVGLACEEIGGALVSIAAAETSIVLNRAVGLGVQQRASAEAVTRIRDRYRDAGVGRFFLHVHPEAEPAGLAGRAAEAGLKPARRWMKFVRGNEPPPDAPASLRVEEIGTEHADAAAGIIAAGFDISPDAAPMLAGLVGRPGWHVYMSFAGDEPAGTGTMFVDGEVAWLDWGATAPAHRRQGSQTAILTRRVRDALSMGCRLMMTTTGEEVPDDPQHSYHNIERVGFRPAYLRDNYAPA